MEHHLDKKVVLDNEPELKGLYSWSLNEVGESGPQGRQNQILWHWSLAFTLSDLQLLSTVSNDRHLGPGNGTSVVFEKEFIKAKLRSGYPEEDRLPPRFSMLGTDRFIEDISVAIYPTTEGEGEVCRAAGSVAYTAEIDFRNEAYDYSLFFALHLNRERFSRLASRIERKAIGGGVLRVGMVAGFYADWSPSISTHFVKVLTHDKRGHPVEVPEGCAIEPSRLGEVGEFDLTLWSEPLQPSPPPVEALDDDDLDTRGSYAPPDAAPQAQAQVVDAKTLSLLKSMRVAVWIIAVLLSVIAIK
jgi:hypothetical protein